ncbi:permease YjgP/YjgQ family protein [Pseudopedobacter saltans DSM 12145]|uniref:Permease YjgP/YjgQ family protein n=1 Tax=Pseudopedobacter saltans (strain ATCC 51119 / DSM 12145 / JCM 21818 / CCUG 39354 / LMG 10337 / NBRC 100064 / NCIMB 13643) TaxID=762903 RepID=F0S8R7_PSESL|nr:LptF/LptG family permease [Pseudopedobacter saltans]ADY52398.1 permease YjgP/YjgQ family protein [Pseudopedobacter saltans DSM 12145]
MKFLDKYIKLIDWYIIRKYLGTFVFTMAIFTLISVVFDISEKLDDFLKSRATFSQVVFEYYAGFIPFYLNFLNPLINFISVIFFTAKMADQTEIVPILTSGASFNRFLRPYFVAATVIFIFNIGFNLFVIPETNRLMINFENTYTKIKDTSRNNVHLQLDSNTYIYMESFDNLRNSGYKFSLEKFDKKDLKEKLMADRISWDSVSHKWKIENYTIRYVDGLKEKMENGTVKDTTLDMKPIDFDIRDNIYSAMNFWELNEKIEKEKIRGSGVMVNLELEKYKRWTYPFSTYVLTLIGVALSSRKVRGGVGLPLGLGILLSFVYILFIQFANVFALKGGLPPIIAVLIPNMLFGALGVYLAIKAPK